jgi:hypothetical protein
LAIPNDDPNDAGTIRARERDGVADSNPLLAEILDDQLHIGTAANNRLPPQGRTQSGA